MQTLAMRLSDAIRRGALLHPQAFYCSHEWDRDGVVIASCALGAAEDAGFDTLSSAAVYADVLGRPVCPICHLRIDFPYRLVTHLNDRHRWRRERIADYIASFESGGE